MKFRIFAGGQMSRLFAILAFVWATGVCAPAWAANVTSSVMKGGKVTISLSGDIAKGDSETMKRLIKAANGAGRLVSGIRLNSNGGNLLEGVKLADIVRFGKIITVVQKSAVCASACFIVFAAGAEKYANYTAMIGVHGASDQNGKETTNSDSATVIMARVVKELGVPPSIIGKMVVTPPAEMVWLTPNELRAMGTHMAGKPAQTAPDTSAEQKPPMQIAPTTQAKKPPTWDEFVEQATAISRKQNSGKPNFTRVCQPELKSCAMGIFFKNNKGLEVIVRRTEDLAGKTISRDFCEFNKFRDIRTCYDWDKGTKSTEMKNQTGQWIPVQ